MKKYLIKFRTAYSIAVILIGLVSFGFTIQSCSGDRFDDIESNTDNISQTTEQKSLTWTEQLEKAMNTPLNIMVNSGIALLDYEIINSNIDNAVDENFYKEEIKADENMIPFYSEDFKSLIAITKKEAILKSSPHQTFNFEQGDEFVDKMNLKGAKILKLRWNNNGVETNTVCAVSDQDGILYDNFISRCFDIEIKTKETVVTDIVKIPRLKVDMETTVSNNGTVTWTLSDELTYSSLFSSKKASIVIKHIGYYQNGQFSYHDFHANGIADPEMAADAVANGINNNTISYGYGIGVNPVNISITLSGTIYSVSFSVSVNGVYSGARRNGSGQHSFPSSLSSIVN